MSCKFSNKEVRVIFCSNYFDLLFSLGSDGKGINNKLHGKSFVIRELRLFAVKCELVLLWLLCSVSTMS